ncbi:MAG: ABC transporter permease subunit [Marinobacter sp.]
MLNTLMREASFADLWYHVSATLRRMVLAFFLAMTLGILIGLIMGLSALINALFDPLLVLLLNLPALVTIILMYVWFGLVESAAIVAVVINKVPNVALTVREGARSPDFRLEDMATVYRFSRWQRFRDVWVPQLFPYLMAATRGGLALIWKIVLVVELLGRSSRWRQPDQLSLGMARRAALARCLAIKPELLLLDEPFASLDPVMAGDLKQLIVGILDANPAMAMICVTHDGGDAATLANRLWYLDGQPARLKWDGWIEEPGQIERLLGKLRESERAG